MTEVAGSRQGRVYAEQIVVLRLGNLADGRYRRACIRALAARVCAGGGCTTGSRAVRGDVKLAIAVPHQVVGITHTRGIHRDRCIFSEWVVAATVFGLHVQRRTDGTRVDTQHRRAQGTFRALAPTAIRGTHRAVAALVHVERTIRAEREAVGHVVTNGTRQIENNIIHRAQVRATHTANLTVPVRHAAEPVGGV